MERLQRWFEPGMSVLVGTVDADGVPSCCRAVAIAPREGLELVTIYIPVATGQETLANIATTQRVAVNCTYPIDHSSVQVKGLTRGVRLAREDEAAFVRASIQAYADSLEHIGLPRRITRTMAHWPAFAIDLSVEEIFDQTPGPKAGNPIR